MAKFLSPVQSLVGSLLLFAVAESPALAASFTGAPLFAEVDEYTTFIDEDPADIYYPVVSNPDESIPLVLMLQGALVDKADYQNYAAIVASYGFTVVVPNNERTLAAPGFPPFTGVFPEQDQVNQVLDFIAVENTRSDAPIAGLVDTQSLGLLGHSFGGAVGIASTQDTCFFVFCAASYSLPEELKGGIFYGTNFDPTQTDVIPPIANQVPTGLILGTLDGVNNSADTVATFEQLLNPPKVLVSVEGANHYGLTNVDSPRDPVRPTLEQAIATETIGRWSGAFLRAHVADDADAWDYIYNSRGDDADSNVEVVAIPESEPTPVSEPTTKAGLLLMGLWGAFAAGSRRP